MRKTITITIDDGRVTVYTDYRPWIRRLKQLEVERPSHITCLAESKAGVQFNAPVDWFKINPSRRYSKESRRQLSQRCKETCLRALEEKRKKKPQQSSESSEA